MHEFQVHRPFDTPRSFQLKIGDEAIEAPMVCGKLILLSLKQHCFFCFGDLGALRTVPLFTGNVLSSIVWYRG